MWKKEDGVADEGHVFAGDDDGVGDDDRRAGLSVWGAGAAKTEASGRRPVKCSGN